jgi:hypothetical protein
MKPQLVDERYCPNNQATSAPRPRSAISDIISRIAGAERILPAPRAPLVAMNTRLEAKKHISYKYKKASPVSENKLNLYDLGESSAF